MGEERGEERGEGGGEGGDWKWVRMLVVPFTVSQTFRVLPETQLVPFRAFFAQ